MALTPEEEEAARRLAEIYNERPYNAASNPGGFGRGGNSAIGLFIAACRDFAGLGRGVVRTALSALSLIEERAAEAEIAALLVQGGPVSSVNGQTGAVVIDLSTISAKIETQLKAVKDAQDALAAAQAGLLDDAIAYSLAFGN